MGIKVILIISRNEKTAQLLFETEAKDQTAFKPNAY